MKTLRLTVVLVAAGAALLAIPGAAAGAERYVGQLVDTSGVAPGSNTDFFTLQIDSYSSDEENKKLLDVLKEKGAKGLQEALWDVKEKGWFRIGSNLGYHAAVIRQRKTDDGYRVIRAFTDRPIMFYELRNSTRSRNYPFGYIELKLDPTGQGEGQMFVAATAKATGNEVELENFHAQPLRILNVKREQ
jgi:hypothetical protein